MNTPERCVEVPRADGPNTLPAGSTQVFTDSLANALMPWDEGYFPDDHTSGQWFPDDSPTVECDIPTVVDADPDNLRLLHLTQEQWDAVDRLLAKGVPVRGIGSHCAHVTAELLDMVRPTFGPAWTLRHHLLEECWNTDDNSDGLAFDFRPSPVCGGVYLIFPDSQA